MKEYQFRYLNNKGNKTMKLSTLCIATLTTLVSFQVMAADMITANQKVEEVIDYVPVGTVIPMIEVKFNCGDCTADTKIKALIEGAYLDQAEKEHAKVNEDDANKIQLTVTHYRSRGKARFFVGMLAGADNIVGNLAYKGTTTEVSDTAVSAVSGIETVARNVGADAYQTLKKSVLAEMPITANADQPTVNLQK